MARHRRYEHMKGVLDFIPHHHQLQRTFTDGLLHAGRFVRCGKGKLEISQRL